MLKDVPSFSMIWKLHGHSTLLSKVSRQCGNQCSRLHLSSSKHMLFKPETLHIYHQSIINVVISVLNKDHSIAQVNQ